MNRMGALPVTKNEYSYIIETIQKELAEKERIKDEFKQQHESLRENFIICLLKGKSSGSIPVHEVKILIDYQMDFNLHQLHVVDVKTPWLQGFSALATRFRKENA